MKYYNVQANVDLDAIRHNIIEMKKHIRSNTKLPEPAGVLDYFAEQMFAWNPT